MSEEGKPAAQEQEMEMRRATKGGKVKRHCFRFWWAYLIALIIIVVVVVCCM